MIVSVADGSVWAIVKVLVLSVPGKIFLASILAPSSNVIELKDSNIKSEGDLILKFLNNKDFVVTMEIGGKNLSSTELAELIDKTFINYPSITFIIGGSDGIDPRVLEKSNYRLSFGRNTYPHGVFRCLLLEQIYRSFKILNNESYHK